MVRQAMTGWMQRPFVALGLLALGMGMIPLNDALIKLMSAYMPLAEIALIRGVLAMILLAGPWLKQIPMAALVAVMISIAVSTADINGLRNLRRIPKSDTSVMLMTFAVTMLTTPHNLALGVLAGVALAGILFSRKVAKVIQVEAVEISDQERLYRVQGQLFFVSKVYFLQGFDLHDHPERITVDLSQAHIWDQSGVAALDQVIRKYRSGGSVVSVIGLNEESLDLFERIGGQESAHA